MTIYSGYDSTIEFEIYGQNQIPLSATFEADVKVFPIVKGDVTVLTTLNTSISVVSSEANTDVSFDQPFVTVISVTFPASVTAGWFESQVITDLVRTDVDPDEYMGFQAVIPVMTTITRVGS